MSSWDERIIANDDDDHHDEKQYMWEVYENQADIYVQPGWAYNSKWKHGEFHFSLICNEFADHACPSSNSFCIQSNKMQVASYHVAILLQI